MCEFIGCSGLENHPSSLGSEHQVNIVFFTWSIKFLRLWLSGTRAWRGAAARAIKPCSACSSKALCWVSGLFGASSSCKDPSEITPALRRCCISQEHDVRGAGSAARWEAGWNEGVSDTHQARLMGLSWLHEPQLQGDWGQWWGAGWHQEPAGDTCPAKHECRRGGEQMLQSQSSPVNACDTLTILFPHRFCHLRQ